VVLTGLVNPDGHDHSGHERHHDHAGPGRVESSRRWLEASWPFVARRLPPPPARVVDLGCGPFGGFVPVLRSAGYEGFGVDPEAPDGPHFHRLEFERYAPTVRVGAIVASASLHHVVDLDAVVSLIVSTLQPDGVLIVLEWAWENFDEASARWCFARLGDDEGWLHRHREGWLASGQPWSSYVNDWFRAEGLHAGQDVLHALSRSFVALDVTYGPYFFADLPAVTPEEEQNAIAAGQIRANGIRYVGRPAPDR